VAIDHPSDDKLIVKSGGAIISCEEVDEARAAGWCINRAPKEWNATIEPDAAALLVKRVGPKLLHLDTELSKLASMAGPDTPITRQLVDQAVVLSRAEKLWIIQEAVVTLDPATMLRKLTEMIQLGGPDIFVPLNWAVMDLMRKIHASAQMLRQGVPPGSVMGKARLWGASGNAILSIARSHEPKILAQLLQHAVDVDRSGKTGYGDKSRSLEALLVTIADRLQSGKREN
jgi:DNA polymerase III delta subunit